MPVMLSISTALKEGCHPERSVLCEVKDLNFATLRCFTAAMNAAGQMRLSLGAKQSISTMAAWDVQVPGTCAPDKVQYGKNS
jgi:hypothetical protein